MSKHRYHQMTSTLASSLIYPRSMSIQSQTLKQPSRISTQMLYLIIAMSPLPILMTDATTGCISGTGSQLQTIFRIAIYPLVAADTPLTLETVRFQEV